MFVSSAENRSELNSFLSFLGRERGEWMFVCVHALHADSLTSDDIMHQLYEAYGQEKGLIIPLQGTDVIIIKEAFQISSYREAKADILKLFPKSCSVSVRKLTPETLDHFKKTYIDTEENAALMSDALFRRRLQRDGNVFLVVEDDPFTQKLLAKQLSEYGKVHMVSEAKDVVPAYLQHNPDIVFLDIHLDGSNGMNVIGEVCNKDSQAFIVMTSADSVEKNVVHSIALGATEFLVKPLTKEKVENILKKSLTVISE